MRRARSGVLVGGLIGWMVALAPGQLPHPAVLTALVGSVSMLMGMGVGLLVRRRHASASLRAGVAVTAGAALVAALWWQTRVSAAVGAEAPGPGWVATVGGVPLAVAALVHLVPAKVWAALAAAAALIAGPAGQAHAVAPNVPDTPALAYSMLGDTSGGFDARAAELVDEWASRPRTGAVVIAVPTGSGWVDASAVDGFTAQFDGDVSFLAMQYSAVPSWQAYVRSPESAGDSAIAVLRALERRVGTVPDRPDVYLFGQSLGAIGADAARAWAVDHGVEVAGTVLSGPPAGSVEELPDCARRVVIANATDPVPTFGADLAWRPPSPTVDATIGARQDIPWLPGVTLVGTALDLVVSLDGPVGTGHHYGSEQGAAVAAMPSGCSAQAAQPMGPRAAS